MKKVGVFLVLMLFISGIIIGCGQEQTSEPEEQVNLTIAAAASLKDAAEELKTVYCDEHQNVNITYNFASSGTLQKQIEEGAPCDLFISAGKKQMDAIAEKDLIIKETRKDLLGNNLVLIAGKDSTLNDFEGLTDDGVIKISIGTPETVPAGKYAKEALTSLDLWDKIESKIVFAKDVRQVLTYVETGNVDAGLVYSSDAIQGKNIKVVSSAPADSHEPIVYPVAVLKRTQNQTEVTDFENFLSSEAAGQIFEKYGFKLLNK
ncbi:MAG: molybdate ABC transporter substrate-binding protein [Bacillota bacterium]|jgi:molybdate transport system substrate-binding protein